MTQPPVRVHTAKSLTAEERYIIGMLATVLPIHVFHKA